jgi:hypothetical protein
MSNPEMPDDPLGLESVDREIRINELEGQLEDMGMEAMGVSDDCPPGVHEQFVNNVMDYDSAPISTQFEALVQEGVELPEPDALDDGALHTKLWEIFHALAKRDVYIDHTDHLSDRELYEHLWHDTFREEGPMMPPGSGWVNHIDILGGCSEEDIKIGQRYYDDEETRRQWAVDFPDDVIPPHEDPPFQRDRLLPKAPEPGMREYVDEEDEEDEDDQG